MSSNLTEKMMCFIFHFCTFIITAHSNLVWVPFEEADANSEVYPITLKEGTCTVTYKRESTCNLVPSCEGDFTPKLKTLVVADCTAGVHCKKITARVEIPSINQPNPKSKNFTYTIGCKPEEAQDSASIIGSSAHVIIPAGIFFFIIFFMGRFIWVRHREFWVSFASRIFPWRARVYNVNTVAGHAMTAQPSDVTSATQQADNGTRSPDEDNDHSMIAQPSEVTSTTQHSNTAHTAQPSEMTSTACKVEVDARAGVHNGTTDMEQRSSAQTFKDLSGKQGVEDHRGEVESNSHKSDAPQRAEATMKFAAKSDEVTRKA